MKSRARPSFWRAYDSLDARAREAARRGDTIVWVWIGTHNEFDKLFS